MSEFDKLKKENKKLRGLLKHAVELLNKYKDVLSKAGAPQTVAPAPAKKKPVARKKVGKPRVAR